MLTRFQALDMEKFVAAVQTAIAASPDTAPDAGVIYIAHTVEMEETGLEGAVITYGEKAYTSEHHSRSIAEFYQSLLDEGKIGRPGDRLRIAQVAMTGNPVNDIIQIAGGLHRRELERKAEKEAQS